MRRGEGTLHGCSHCSREVFVLDSDGDREGLKGWTQTIDLQTGNDISVMCPACAES